MPPQRSPHPGNDLRLRRTRRLLRDALVALSAERGYEALHVNDIADRAGINRATFYRHYADKHDLLARCMDDVVEELAARASTPPPDAAGRDAGRETLRLLFEHAAENADFYRVMLGAEAFRARIQEALEALLRQRWEAARLASAAPRILPPLVISATAAALISFIAWWAARGCEQSPAQMAEYAAVFMERGPAWTLGWDGVSSGS